MKPPIYFTDRDLGTQFPSILEQAGFAVERHRHHFRPDCPDEEWLAEVGRRGWVAITHDSRIRYKPNERDAVVRHGVRLLVVVGKAPFAVLAASFLSTRSRVESFLSRTDAPFIAKVYRATPADLARDPSAPGRIELWFPK